MRIMSHTFTPPSLTTQVWLLQSDDNDWLLCLEGSYANDTDTSPNAKDVFVLFFQMFVIRLRPEPRVARRASIFSSHNRRNNQFAHWFEWATGKGPKVVVP